MGPKWPESTRAACTSCPGSKMSSTHQWAAIRSRRYWARCSCGSWLTTATRTPGWLTVAWINRVAFSVKYGAANITKCIRPPFQLEGVGKALRSIPPRADTAGCGHDGNHERRVVHYRTDNVAGWS